MTIDSKAMEHIKNVLKQFGEKYFSTDGNLKRNNVIEDLDNYDKDLMTAIFNDDFLHKTYTTKIANVEVFELNKFVDMLRYKEYWQDSFTKFNNKIGLAVGDKYIDDSSDVVLNFPYKDCVLKAGMTKEDVEHSGDADEPFLNETLAKSEIDELFEPKILVNATEYDQKGDHKISKFSNKDNLIIKGNNLIALYSLQKKFAEKIKLIYIDPPYNTGNDSFKYNDSFSQSSWLTFMLNRLQISKELLMDSGVIFVQCDDNEQAELKILMDQIFGKQNFVAQIIDVVKPEGRRYGYIARAHEYILVYAKNTTMLTMNEMTDKKKKLPYKDEYGNFEIVGLRNRNNRAFNSTNRPNLRYPFYVDIKNNDSNGFMKVSPTPMEGWEKVYPRTINNIKSVWRWGVDKAKAQVKDLIAKRNKNNEIIIYQKSRSQTTMPTTIWQDKNFISQKGTQQINKLFDRNNFSFPKPEALIKRIIEISTDPTDLVLDFFMGSGTTMAVAMKMHRQFIGIDQMDYINSVSIPRLSKVINGEQGGISKEVNWQGENSFIYAELMEKNQGYLKNIQSASDMDTLMKVYSLMKQNGDLDFRVDLDKFEASLKAGELPSLEDRRKELIKIIDKNQLYYNYSDIDDANVRNLISKSDYQFNKSFYSLDKGGE